jgi:hypothetical protein
VTGSDCTLEGVALYEGNMFKIKFLGVIMSLCRQFKYIFLIPLLSVQVRYLTDVGQGPRSKKTEWLRPYPSSGPTLISLEYPDSNTVHARWQPPAKVAEGFVLRGYDVTPDSGQLVKRVNVSEVNMTSRSPNLEYQLTITPVFAMSSSSITDEFIGKSITIMVRISTE